MRFTEYKLINGTEFGRNINNTMFNMTQSFVYIEMICIYIFLILCNQVCLEIYIFIKKFYSILEKRIEKKFGFTLLVQALLMRNYSEA